MTAPHLPPRIVSMDFPKRRMRLILLFSMIFLCVLTSLATTLALVAWIVPFTDATESFHRLERLIDREPRQISPDPVRVRETSERLLTILDRRLYLSDSLYGEAAVVATAASISSDGWIVFSLPKHASFSPQSWDILTNSRESLGISKSIRDPLTGLIYIKTNGEGMRVFSFAKGNAGDTLWGILPDRWRETKMFGLENNTEDLSQKRKAIWKLFSFDSLNPALPAGTPIVTSAGELAGIVNTEGLLIPSSFIALQIPTVFDTGTIAYAGIPVEGFVVSGMLDEDGGSALSGFFITKITDSRFRDLRIGDVITAINGATFQKETTLLFSSLAPQPITVTILRDDAEQIITVIPVVVVKSNI